MNKWQHDLTAHGKLIANWDSHKEKMRHHAATHSSGTRTLESGMQPSLAAYSLDFYKRTSKSQSGASALQDMVSKAESKFRSRAKLKPEKVRTEKAWLHSLVRGLHTMDMEPEAELSRLYAAKPRFPRRRPMFFSRLLKMDANSRHFLTKFRAPLNCLSRDPWYDLNFSEACLMPSRDTGAHKVFPLTCGKKLLPLLRI